MEPQQPYLQRIRDRFPQLPLSSVRAIHDGLVNEVLIVNEALVFRFPKNDHWAKTLLANEIKVVNLLHHYVELPIPTFEQATADLVVYKLLPGRPLQRHDILGLDEAEQERLAEQLATFLRQMHHVPLAAVEHAGIVQSDANRSPAVWCQLFEDVQRELFPFMMAHTQDWVRHHFAPILSDPGWMKYSPALVNGDLAPYHILYEKPEATITGLIDFGTAGLGDPAADFACLISNYGESFLRRMTQFYPEIREGLDRARFWAGTIELQWALRGLRSQEMSWFLVHLGSARDVRPIGGGGA